MGALATTLRHEYDMNLLFLTCLLAVTAAAPQYSFPQPSPRFPVAQRAPVQTYKAPTQAPRRVAAPVRTYNAPVTTPAPRYTAPRRVAAPVRTYKAPVTAAPAPAPRYNAPAPAATYNAPTFRIGAPVVPILRDERHMGDSGEYNFEFETGNGILHSEQGEELDEGGMTKEGYWKFTFPDGTPAVFHFRAGKDGFQVEPDLLPVAPPMPAHAIAQIEKARLEDEAFARASASAPRRKYEQPRNTYNTPQ